MEKMDNARPRSWRARWSAVLAAVLATPALVAVAPPAPATAAGNDHVMAYVIRKWEIVPPQANNCIYNGAPFGGPDAHYDPTLPATCGSYQYTDFINPEGQRYRYTYQHVTGASYTYYGYDDPEPPTNVPADKIKTPEPPLPPFATRSTPEEFSGALIGTWRIKPVNVGQWYVRNVMTVSAGGYGNLMGRDVDACDWKVGTPTYRNLKGHGPTYTGERFLGPCMPWDRAWAPVSITVAPDGSSFTENVAGYPALNWLREPTTLDCGNGQFTASDLIRWGAKLNMSNDEIVAWLDKPCNSVTVSVAAADHQTLPGQDKGDGKNGKCDGMARDRLVGKVKVGRFEFEVGSAIMTTSFCYNGKIVYKAGTDEAPNHATFQNPNAAGNFLLTCTYTGSLDNDFDYGYVDDTKRGFFTTGTIGFTCTGPSLVLGVEVEGVNVGMQFNKAGNAYLTATQVVWQDGRSEFNLGGRR